MLKSSFFQCSTLLPNFKRGIGGHASMHWLLFQQSILGSCSWFCHSMHKGEHPNSNPLTLHLLTWPWTMIWYLLSMFWYHLMNHRASMIATKPIHQSFPPTSTKLHRASVCKSPHLQTNLSSPSIVWALKSRHDLQLNLHVWVMSGFLLSYWFWQRLSKLWPLPSKGSFTVSKCSFRDGIEAVNHFTLRHLAGGFPGWMMMLYCWKNKRTKSARFQKSLKNTFVFCADGVRLVSLVRFCSNWRTLVQRWTKAGYGWMS